MTALAGQLRDTALAERLTALREAVDAVDGVLPLEVVQPARDLLAKAGARIALGEATVVALAGATGSGKSSLFNALAGAPLSASGVRRPTTGTAHACTWGDAGTPQLLDWLGVSRRHVQPEPDPALDGLVLLDLPDHDSTRLEHRLEVDRLVELVDVLIWVLDPQKYADAAVHDRYLRPHAAHAGVVVVVLNQIDRLDPVERQACLGDLRRLLDGDGLAGVPVVDLSARTGAGVPQLRALLADRVRARRAASERLAADVRRVAGQLADCTGTPGEVRREDRQALVAALADAAGVRLVQNAVERSVRREGALRTGWPGFRWTRRARPDPLRRLHLGGAPDERVRTSLASASGVQQAAVTDAVRRVRDAAGLGLPPVWRDRLRAVVAEREHDLPDRLDRAVAGADLGVARLPRWWGAVGLLQWLLLAVALSGGLWLLALAGLGFARLDGVLPLPRSGGVPVPTLLLVVGLLAGVLLAALARPLVGSSARRRGRRAGDRIRERVDAVAREHLLGPLADVTASYQRWCAALAAAQRPAGSGRGIRSPLRQGELR